jgi:hypothetical protein
MKFPLWQRALAFIAGGAVTGLLVTVLSGYWLS